jgi:predicted RNA binding protein YcfA (HicA-like mRNA interferase family)
MVTKYRVFKPRELENFFIDMGFEPVNTEGSHKHFKHPVTGKKVTIAISKDDFEIGTVRKKLRSACVEFKDFVSYFYGSFIASCLPQVEEHDTDTSDRDTENNESWSSEHEDVAEVAESSTAKVVISGETPINELEGISAEQVNKYERLGIRTTEQLFLKMKSGVMSDSARAEISNLFQDIKIRPATKKPHASLVTNSALELKDRPATESNDDKKKRFDEKIERNMKRNARKKAIQKLHNEIVKTVRSATVIRQRQLEHGSAMVTTIDPHQIFKVLGFPHKSVTDEIYQLIGSQVLRGYFKEKMDEKEKHKRKHARKAANATFTFKDLVMGNDVFEHLPKDIKPEVLLFVFAIYGTVYTVPQAMIDAAVIRLDLETLLYGNDKDINQCEDIKADENRQDITSTANRLI